MLLVSVIEMGQCRLSGVQLRNQVGNGDGNSVET